MNAHEPSARQPDREPVPLESMTAPAFRSIVAERLRLLERELAEVRTRVTGCSSSWPARR